MYKKLNLRKKLFQTDFFVVLVFVFLMVVSVFYLQSDIVDELAAYGVIGLMFVSFLLEFLPQFIAPQIFLLISIASGIGIIKALFFSILGSSLGAILAFYIGKKYGLSFFKRIISKKKVDKFLILAEKYGKIAIFIAAISPFPYIPVIFATLGITWKDFILFGVIPRAFSFVLIAYAFSIGLSIPMLI
ncbi:MAG: VTT domain-containing protein [Candidatus Woesearchaeota archaeon]